MKEIQLSKQVPRLRNLVSDRDLFGYLRQDTLNIIALSIVALSWLGAFILYDPVDRQVLVTWLPAVGVIWLGCSLTLALNQRHFHLAVLALGTFLLIADGMALYVFQNGQLLYFAVPIISLANYLVGPSAAGAVSVGIALLAGLGMSIGVPLSELAGPLILTILTTTLNWLSSRYLHLTLQWAWTNHLRSLEKAEEAQHHRAEVARANRSLEEALHRLNRLNEDLVKAWRVAEEAERFKSELAANISHELRTPLYIIVGFSETMLFSPESYGEALPAAYRSDLIEVYNSSRHLLSLTNDVLDLSQIEAGRMGLVKEITDVAEVIQEAVDLVLPLVRRKGLTLRIEIPKPIPLLRLDRTRARQVLLNLLNNATRYVEQGEIAVEARIKGSRLLISVSDTGPGIPTEQLTRIFESFYQVDSSISRRHNGVGLGLAISKYFVEMHDGRIWAESELGVGSCFNVSLPLPEDVGERSHPLARLHRKAPEPFVHRDEESILVIHPDPMTAQLLERHLERVRVVYAADTTAAEQQLAGSHPKAIVTGESNASAVLSLLKDRMQACRLPSIPVITCHIPNDARSAIALGAQSYLVKPVTTERLLSTLERAAPDARRILVVDDDPRVVRLLSRMLLSNPRQYQVLRAFGGGEALELMRTELPDAVLLDLYMPEPDGFSVLDHMTKDSILAQIPVIVVSAKGLPEDGVLQLGSPIMVNQPDTLTLAQFFRFLQALLDVSGPVRVSERASGQEFVGVSPDSRACV
jgi:signal transduction histidine kinase/DNA-binding response OmpR family regulator